MNALTWRPQHRQGSGDYGGRCEICERHLALAKEISREYHGDISAVTTCRVCKGVVIISLTDERCKLLSYRDMLGWFYQLHVRQMRCIANKEHVEEQGWGHYWNFDQILKQAHFKDWEIDHLARGKRPHFGIDIGGKQPIVYVVKTNLDINLDRIMHGDLPG